MFRIRTVFSLISFLALGLVFNSCSADNTVATDSVSADKASDNYEAVYDEYPQAEILKKYLKPFPDNLTRATSNNAVEAKAAMAAYNAGKYQMAIDTFPNFSRRPDLIGYIHLYKGISYLMAGNEHDAFLTFQLIRANQQPAFQVSEWYKAMCYIAYNNIYEARRKLESIVEKETYGKEEAAELLGILPVK